MKLNHCAKTHKNGITPMKLLGIVPMSNRAKAVVLGLMTTFTGVAVAQQSDAKLLADASVTKTEISKNDKIVENPVSVGNTVDASKRSRDEEIIVIHISGGKGKPGQPEPLTAKQYAERLVEGFKSSEYTKYPTNIAVVYEESGKDRPTGAMVFINGHRFETKNGYSVFTPIQIGDNIDLFTTKYMKSKGLAVLDGSTPKVASNDPN